ncbi:MAG: tetratricopeptide repeat protein [Cyanobacteria bacterium J06649_4]
MIKSLLRYLQRCLRWFRPFKLGGRQPPLASEQAAKETYRKAAQQTAAGDRISLSMPRAEVVIALNKTLQHSGPAETGKQNSVAQQSTQNKDSKSQYSDHPDLIQSLADSGYLCECQGRMGEAERLYKQALMLSERRYGPHHLEIATRLSDLATLYYEQQRYELAESLLARLVEVRSHHQPAQHIDLAQARYQLAQLYCVQQRHAAAEPVLQKAIAVFTETFGLEHSQTQAARELLLETLCANIQALQSGQAVEPLSALDLDQLSETYSWAHPHWMHPTADDTYSWVLTGWGRAID